VSLGFNATPSKGHPDEKATSAVSLASAAAGLLASATMKSFVSLSFALLALLLLASAGCRRHDHAGSGSHGGHVHIAPHGGTLVEIGDHAYNVELLRNGVEGKLTAWVLDAHAENFVRIAAPSIEVVGFVGGERRSVTLQPVANPATGEMVGSTAQYEGQADWLKSAAEFPGQITSIEIRGRKYDNVALYLRKGK
jgi:hypothetical protein